jgi:uncharacterized protein
MMRNEINDALKTAMKSGDKATLSTLRMVNAKIKDADIASRPSGKEKISDGEIVELMMRMVKQRRESIALYEQGGRQELADQEAAEIAVIEAYLPKAMNEADSAAAIAAVIAETGAATVKDMGKVMAILKERHAGQMDFGKIGGLVKEALK